MKTTPLTARLILALGLCQFSFAKEWTGNGDGLDWHDAANWSDNVVPDSSGDFPSISGDGYRPFNTEINQALDIGQIYTGGGTQAVFGDVDSVINMNANVRGKPTD